MNQQAYFMVFRYTRRLTLITEDGASGYFLTTFRGKLKILFFLCGTSKLVSINVRIILICTTTKKNFTSGKQFL